MGIDWGKVAEEEEAERVAEWEREQRDGKIRLRLAKALYERYGPRHPKWELARTEEMRNWLLDADTLMGILE